MVLMLKKKVLRRRYLCVCLYSPFASHIRSWSSSWAPCRRSWREGRVAGPPHKAACANRSTPSDKRTVHCVTRCLTPPNVFSGYTRVALKCTFYLDCKEWVKAENWTLRLPVCLWIEDPRAREAPSECLEEKPCRCWEGKSQNVWEQYATCDQRS